MRGLRGMHAVGAEVPADGDERRLFGQVEVARHVCEEVELQPVVGKDRLDVDQLAAHQRVARLPDDVVGRGKQAADDRLAVDLRDLTVVEDPRRSPDDVPGGVDEHPLMEGECGVGMRLQGGHERRHRVGLEDVVVEEDLDVGAGRALPQAPEVQLGIAETMVVIADPRVVDARDDGLQPPVGRVVAHEDLDVGARLRAGAGDGFQQVLRFEGRDDDADEGRRAHTRVIGAGGDSVEGETSRPATRRARGRIVPAVHRLEVDLVDGPEVDGALGPGDHAARAPRCTSCATRAAMSARSVAARTTARRSARAAGSVRASAAARSW